MASEDGWKYEFADRVSVCGTARVGQVVGRSEHIDGREDYFVRFVSREGRTERAWIPSIDLVMAPEAPSAEAA